MIHWFQGKTNINIKKWNHGISEWFAQIFNNQVSQQTLITGRYLAYTRGVAPRLPTSNTPVASPPTSWEARNYQLLPWKIVFWMRFTPLGSLFLQVWYWTILAIPKGSRIVFQSHHFWRVNSQLNFGGDLWTSWPYQGIMMVNFNKVEYNFLGGGKGVGHWERMIPVDFHDVWAFVRNGMQY